jgi:long-chain acyl-CoA synthetase
MNIVQTIHNETREHFHRTAIIDGDRQITYGELLEQAGQLSEQLIARGITAGHRIGLHSGDGIDYVIAALALLQTGAAVVPIADNITAIEVHETIDRIDLQGVLVHAKIKRTEQEQSAEKIAEMFSFQPRLARGDADENCRQMGAAFIRFSSGTTGASKGVVLSHRSIIDRTDAADRGLGITSDDVILWVLSMSYHFVVSILLFLRRGATIVVANQFFPFSLLSAATKHPITFIYASPVHYHLLGQSDAVKPEALKNVRLAISTAMKMPANVSQRFAEKFGFAPAEAYGIIEIGLPFINTQPRATPLPSVGPALPDYQLRIANPDADGIGEVLIKGKGMFDAYFSPWRTLAEVTDDGWFDTGDLGKLDEEGRLYLLGRSKTVLVCAGMKVFPEEVEQVINTMPGVKESLVSGKDHPQFGQMPIARVVMLSPIDTNELRTYCCQQLSAYKVPVEFSIVESLPKTASGKLARK